MLIFKSRSWLPLLMIVFVGACVKDPQDIPPGMTTDPQFGMSAHFGNEVIDINAGVAGWTAVPVVNEADSFHVYAAVMSQNGCIHQCTSSWTFNFIQATSTSFNEEDKFLNTIRQGPVDFVLSDAERDSFAVSISTHPDVFLNGVSYWEDPGSSNFTYSSELTENIGSNEIFDICFQSIVYAGCQYNQCVYFTPSTLIPCIAHIEASVVDGRYVKLTVVPEGTPPFQIDWEDGPSTSSIVVAAASPVQDIYAQVTVTDANGNRAELMQTVRLDSTIVDACYYPIAIESHSFTDYSAGIAAGDLEVVHVDEAGSEWRSTKTIQPGESHAEIHEVSYYGLSPEGWPTYKAAMSIHVLLANSSTGETRWFDASDIVLPLSHPE